jgi:hypothetical protein
MLLSIFKEKFSDADDRFWERHGFGDLSEKEHALVYCPDTEMSPI